MTQRLLIISFFCLVMTTACRSTKAANSGVKSPFVILKLDDLWCKGKVVHTGWQSVINYLNQQGIKGSIGLIGDSLEEDNTEYFDWIQQRKTEGHEIWNHGFCHCRDKEAGISEFRGKSELEQIESIKRTQSLAKEKLNITLQTFGAPYNNTDQQTVDALEEITDLKVWLYKETEIPTDKYQLKRIKEVNIEYPVHEPDYEQFVKGYEKYKDEPILIIQGHPRSWVEDKSRLEEFKRIITFLKKVNVRFVTPYEYYSMTNDKTVSK